MPGALNYGVRHVNTVRVDTGIRVIESGFLDTHIEQDSINPGSNHNLHLVGTLFDEHVTNITLYHGFR